MHRKDSMMTKDKVVEAVREMPQEFDLEELIERLIFIDKVEKGIKQLDEGEAVSYNDLKKLLHKLKSER